MIEPVLDATRFLPVVGQVCMLTREELAVEAVLSKVVEYPGGTAPGSKRTAFSLFLSVASDGASDFQSGSYLLRHHSFDSVGPVYVERVLSVDPKIIRLEVGFN